VRFGRAIVRPPARSFAGGITTAGLGVPDLARALEQHAGYCSALGDAGLEVVSLPAEPEHPDSTFVEDTAIVTGRGVVLCRPGAASRTGEVKSMAGALRRMGIEFTAIEPPGTVDGGDVCEAGERFLIGISGRTNEEGARQLGAILAGWGYGSATIDIREVAGLLHLKTGISELGGGRLAVLESLSSLPALAGFEVVPVDGDEAYAANCVWLGDRVLVAAGFPRFAARLHASGETVVELGMSEFRKMDGGLSCLSLRFPAGPGL